MAFSFNLELAAYGGSPPRDGFCPKRKIDPYSLVLSGVRLARAADAANPERMTPEQIAIEDKRVALAAMERQKDLMSENPEAETRQSGWTALATPGAFVATLAACVLLCAIVGAAIVYMIVTSDKPDPNSMILITFSRADKAIIFGAIPGALVGLFVTAVVWPIVKRSMRRPAA